MTANAHNRSLSRMLRSTPLTEYLEKLEWRIVRSPGRPFILGDGVVIGWRESTGFIHVLNSALSEVNIGVPISRDAALVGEVPASMGIPEHNLNQGSAELSLEFFVSAKNSDCEREYQSLIGAKAQLLSTEEIKASLLQQ